MPLAPPTPHKYWLITNHTFAWGPTGKHICVITDVPSHLYLHYHPLAPGRHLRMVLRRGVVTFKDPHYGFEEYQVVFQNEPGDTLSHTFDVDPWPGTPFLWYQFKGNIGGIKSPSVSPWWWQNENLLTFCHIFTEPWTYLAPPPPPPPEMCHIFTEPWTYPEPPLEWCIIYTEPWSS